LKLKNIFTSNLANKVRLSFPKMDQRSKKMQKK